MPVDQLAEVHVELHVWVSAWPGVAAGGDDSGMRLASDRPRVAVAVALVLSGGGFAALAVYLWRVGLARADQLSSVVAMFVALGTTLGVWSPSYGLGRPV